MALTGLRSIAELTGLNHVKAPIIIIIIYFFSGFFFQLLRWSPFTFLWTEKGSKRFVQQELKWDTISVIKETFGLKRHIYIGLTTIDRV